MIRKKGLYQPNISELIDMLSIFFIKEIKDQKNKKINLKLKILEN